MLQRSVERPPAADDACGPSVETRARSALARRDNRDVSNLISPKDLPTWVPGRVLSASDDLGWTGVAHRAYRYTGLDLPIPPMDTFMVVRYQNGHTPMDRRFDGRWTRTTCTPGDFSLLTRSQQSHWHWTEVIDVSHVCLSEDLMARVASDMLERTVAEVHLHDLLRAQDPVVTSIADAITQEARQQNLGGALYVESLGVQLAVHLLRRYASVTFRDAVPVGGMSPSLMRRTAEYVEEHLDNSISLDDLAQALGMGVWTLTRRFKQSFGCSPYSYVLDRRVHRAQRLLMQGELAVKEIAAACGFADQAHMTRVFRARLGVTPAQVRRGS